MKLGSIKYIKIYLHRVTDYSPFPVATLQELGLIPGSKGTLLYRLLGHRKTNYSSNNKTHGK